MVNIESIYFGVAITLHDNNSENYITTLGDRKHIYHIKGDLDRGLIYIDKEGSSKTVVVPMANVRRFIVSEGVNESETSGNSGGAKKKASNKA